ncbi:hypothetical protein D0863_11297 [Hortaea werneckii]|uniref:Uncharacterized protein n=1 Tax=Hortaea werneckii TaxID=91943 RepID=A0A3M7DB49_HORWE|nr:hypothetical protein D0863_11297 [Hortaea werneckii]
MVGQVPLASKPMPQCPGAQRRPTLPESTSGISLGYGSSSFDSTNDASILLLGIRGTGKTSIGILAASHTGFRLIDADQQFYRTTGYLRASYAAKHGLDEYRAKELALMRKILETNPTRCIIVCGPGSAEGTGRDLIKEFRKEHPVIHVLRDATDIQAYLRTDNVEKISGLADMIGPWYRSISSHEFYNVSDPVDVGQKETLHGWVPQQHPALYLKHLQIDVHRLMDAVTIHRARPYDLQAQHSLSDLPLEAKPYTYAMVVDFRQISSDISELRRTELIADAVELRIKLGDLVNEQTGHFSESSATLLTRQYYVLRRYAPVPIIFHLEISQAEFETQWSVYRDILAYALRLAPEYLTVNLNSGSKIFEDLFSRRRSTKIIGHFFDSHPVKDAWSRQERMSMLDRARSLGCDLVRICQHTEDAGNNFDVEKFRLWARHINPKGPPLIAYNTGYQGRSSLFVNRIFTPVGLETLDHPSFRDQDQQITVQSAQKALYASFILDKLTFGIFEDAVSNAMSPLMHNSAFGFCGMPHVYQTFQAASLHQLKHLLYDKTFGGASISSPFKEDVMSIADYLSQEARAIGAANTLIPLRSRALESIVDRNRAGPVEALYGDNTDWIGIHTCIRSHLSPINAIKSRSTALVLGAGGMARATIYALQRLQVQTIFVWNRTARNAEKMISMFDGNRSSTQGQFAHCTEDALPRESSARSADSKTVRPARIFSLSSMSEPWPSEFEPPTIVVSCISRVTQPPPEIVLPESWLRSQTGGVVIELAYDPADSPLLRQARGFAAKGWIAVDGLQVLPEQGIAQFELFTGRRAPRKLMRDLVAQHTRAQENQP